MELTLGITARLKLRRQEGEAASNFFSFAPVKSHWPTMTCRSNCADKKGEAASSLCPFASVESFLAANAIIGERTRCWDIYSVVVWLLLGSACPRQGLNPGLHTKLPSQWQLNKNCADKKGKSRPFVLVESFLAEKVGIGERMRRGDICWAVAWQLLAQGRVWLASLQVVGSGALPFKTCFER